MTALSPEYRDAALATLAEAEVDVRDDALMRGQECHRVRQSDDGNSI